MRFLRTKNSTHLLNVSNIAKISIVESAGDWLIVAYEKGFHGDEWLGVLNDFRDQEEAKKYLQRLYESIC